MPRNILQDIVPPEKRSIRNIPLPDRGRKIGRDNPPKNDLAHSASAEEEATRIYPYTAPMKKRLIPKWAIIAGGLIILLALSFILSSLFSSATITVTPRQSLVKAESEDFIAKKSTSDPMSFEVAVLEKEGGEIVPASGEERKEVKASGKILIYNNYDSSSQRLIKNTRFQTPEGLTYRINESVVISGKTTKDGKSTPGSVEVVVYADEPGEKYNIGLTDFTIPGFKDDPGRFKEIYARSKTEITGGFVGMMKKVSEADSANAKDRVRSKLKEELSQEIEAQIPENFVLFEKAKIYKFETLPQSEARGDSVRVNEKVKLYGVLIRRDLLAKAIAERLDPDFAGEESGVDVSNWDEVEFGIKETEGFDPERDLELNFGIDGSINLTLVFDKRQLQFDLAGKPKKRLTTILANYPSIEKAEASVKPIWKRSFPGNAEDIEVVYRVHEES